MTTDMCKMQLTSEEQFVYNFLTQRPDTLSDDDLVLLRAFSKCIDTNKPMFEKLSFKQYMMRYSNYFEPTKDSDVKHISFKDKVDEFLKTLNELPEVEFADKLNDFVQTNKPVSFDSFMFEWKDIVCEFNLEELKLYIKQDSIFKLHSCLTYNDLPYVIYRRYYKGKLIHEGIEETQYAIEKELGCKEVPEASKYLHSLFATKGGFMSNLLTLFHISETWAYYYNIKRKRVQLLCSFLSGRLPDRGITIRKTTVMGNSYYIENEYDDKNRLVFRTYEDEVESALNKYFLDEANTDIDKASYLSEACRYHPGIVVEDMKGRKWRYIAEKNVSSHGIPKDILETRTQYAVLVQESKTTCIFGLNPEDYVTVDKHTFMLLKKYKVVAGGIGRNEVSLVYENEFVNTIMRLNNMEPTDCVHELSSLVGARPIPQGLLFMANKIWLVTPDKQMWFYSRTNEVKVETNITEYLKENSKYEPLLKYDKDGVLIVSEDEVVSYLKTHNPLENASYLWGLVERGTISENSYYKADEKIWLLDIVSEKIYLLEVVTTDVGGTGYCVNNLLEKNFNATRYRVRGKLNLTTRLMMLFKQDELTEIKLSKEEIQQLIITLTQEEIMKLTTQMAFDHVLPDNHNQFWHKEAQEVCCFKQQEYGEEFIVLDVKKFQVNNRTNTCWFPETQKFHNVVVSNINYEAVPKTYMGTGFILEGIRKEIGGVPELKIARLSESKYLYYFPSKYNGIVLGTVGTGKVESYNKITEAQINGLKFLLGWNNISIDTYTITL